MCVGGVPENVTDDYKGVEAVEGVGWATGGWVCCCDDSGPAP